MYVRIGLVRMQRHHVLVTCKLPRRQRLNGTQLRISAHRGRRFSLIVDGISAGSWTLFQRDRGRHFSRIVDGPGARK